MSGSRAAAALDGKAAAGSGEAGDSDGTARMKRTGGSGLGTAGPCRIEEGAAAQQSSSGSLVQRRERGNERRGEHGKEEGQGGGR